jgi:starvation-inducible DNA-binding protein
MAQPTTTRTDRPTPADRPSPVPSPPVTSRRQARVTVPTLTVEQGTDLAERLQRRLVALIDLGLTLRHIHWNVVGSNFIAVHEMLDPQHAGVQAMVDDLAERIATLGGVPSGLPGRIVDQRSWDDYDLDRADSIAHLGALDLVYQGVIQEHRAEIDEVEELDPVTQDLLIGQTAILEKYHWFVRSHLVDWAGGTANAGATTELAAAQAVAAKAHTPTGSRTTRNAGDAGVSGTAATAATTATAADAAVTAEGR